MKTHLLCTYHTHGGVGLLERGLWWPEQHPHTRCQPVSSSDLLRTKILIVYINESPVSTRPILQSFVSSHKTDIFKTCSAEVNAFISLPYACQYSNGAKEGGEPLLAVTTEQGVVHILNTRKRKDWDCGMTLNLVSR